MLFRDDNEDVKKADQPFIDYDAGRYSPRLLQLTDLEPDTLVTDIEDDMKRLQFARMQMFKTGKAMVSQMYNYVYSRD